MANVFSKKVYSEKIYREGRVRWETVSVRVKGVSVTGEKAKRNYNGMEGGQ